VSHKQIFMVVLVDLALTAVMYYILKKSLTASLTATANGTTN
jgi:hypothetical protein